MAKPVLEFLEVAKNYGEFSAVERMSFTLSAGEFFTLLGPSGCGKTTTLRLAAGLEEPDAREIVLNESGRVVTESGEHPPRRRQLFRRHRMELDRHRTTRQPRKSLEDIEGEQKITGRKPAGYLGHCG
jgi:ABC-type multidrug transport system ATPase subunit